MSRPWPPYAAREAVLADLERAIAATPAALDTRFYYASFLRDHGRLDDAIAVFTEVLAVAPDHVETLVAYAAVLARRGRRRDARAAYERALAIDPSHYPALVSLANLLALDDPARAETLYRAALALDPQRAAAHRGMCSLAAARGDERTAAVHRAAGYAAGPFGRRPYLGATTPMPVLALLSTDGGNIPLESLLDPYRFAVAELYVEAYRDEPLPAHALIVNAIADADRAGAALTRTAGIIARSPRTINPPALVALTGRRANAVRLAALRDVVAPEVWLAHERMPDAFPAIVRVPGLHMGRGMARCDDAAAYVHALESFAARSDALALRYVDVRSPDGAWRKYRVMAIGGALYPLHLAIAARWDVHYFSSAMAENPAYRREEAAFLGDPGAAIGARAWQALERVCALLGLDYAGVDFGLHADGRIVVFEANAAMTVLPPDQTERFRYRVPAAERITTAIANLMRSAASDELVVDVADQKDDR